MSKPLQKTTRAIERTRFVQLLGNQDPIHALTLIKAINI